jgi:two-component system sensor histidine kinase BaeS
MSRSITTKIVLAFLFVNLIVIGLAALFLWTTTSSQFSKYLFNQQQTQFISAVTEYYQTNGDWSGVETVMGSQIMPPAQIQPGVAPPKPQPFALVDQNRVVIIPGGEYQVGQRIQKGVLEKGIGIEVNNQVVGTVIVSGQLPIRSTIDNKYLSSVTQSLVIAALGGTVIAFVLGLFIARNLTNPLRNLTTATRAMARGELEQQVPVGSQDELGELAISFNQMSADLARANQSHRQMTADIAHDLRSPLTVIGGYAESMRDGVLKPTPERFEAIHTEVQHLQRLVEDLRTLSKADSKELGLNREPVSPSAFLERMAQAYRPLALKQEITLKTELSNDLPNLHADPDRLAQVFGNLITNSLRHTPQAGEIILFARAEEKHIVLGVIDSGSGINPDLLPTIFERFRRGDASRQDGGSGLGLAIAKAIIELHGGSISAKNNVSKGTTITIRFPR